MEELAATEEVVEEEEEVAAAAAGRTAMLPSSCCKPVMRTERRVEGGDDKGWAAGRCAAGDEGGRWPPCLAAATAPHLFRAPSDRRAAPARSGRLARLAKMASPFVNNLTQNGRLSIRRAEPGGGIA